MKLLGYIFAAMAVLSVIAIACGAYQHVLTALISGAMAASILDEEKEESEIN